MIDEETKAKKNYSVKQGEFDADILFKQTVISIQLVDREARKIDVWDRKCKPGIKDLKHKTIRNLITIYGYAGPKSILTWVAGFRFGYDSEIHES